MRELAARYLWLIDQDSPLALLFDFEVSNTASDRQPARQKSKRSIYLFRTRFNLIAIHFAPEDLNPLLLLDVIWLVVDCELS